MAGKLGLVVPGRHQFLEVLNKVLAGQLHLVPDRLYLLGEVDIFSSGRYDSWENIGISSVLTCQILPSQLSNRFVHRIPAIFGSLSYSSDSARNFPLNHRGIPIETLIRERWLYGFVDQSYCHIVYSQEVMIGLYDDLLGIIE